LQFKTIIFLLTFKRSIFLILKCSLIYGFVIRQIAFHCLCLFGQNNGQRCAQHGSIAATQQGLPPAAVC